MKSYLNIFKLLLTATFVIWFVLKPAYSEIERFKTPSTHIGSGIYRGDHKTLKGEFVFWAEPEGGEAFGFFLIAQTNDGRLSIIQADRGCTFHSKLSSKLIDIGFNRTSEWIILSDTEALTHLFINRFVTFNEFTKIAIGNRVEVINKEAFSQAKTLATKLVALFPPKKKFESIYSGQVQAEIASFPIGIAGEFFTGKISQGVIVRSEKGRDKFRHIILIGKDLKKSDDGFEGWVEIIFPISSFTYRETNHYGGIIQGKLSTDDEVWKVPLDDLRYIIQRALSISPEAVLGDEMNNYKAEELKGMFF